jgi:pimeloyl-ACP methyl ester carboxylesterase
VTGLLLIFAVLVTAVVGILFLISPGRPIPLRNEAGAIITGSLSERVFVEINGIRQGMIIQSRDPSNPVLLFLHGGPGMPTFFLNTTHPTGLEQHFTVVWWEQRGAGISFDSSIRPETMNVDQLIDDTIAVTHYLRDRFGQQKIYLLGHSWGSYLGIQVASKSPDLFHAYISMGEVVYQLRSEVAAYAYLLDAYRARGDTAMVQRLEAAPVSMADSLSDAWMRIRDEAMHKLGVGTTRDMPSVITGIFLPVWYSRAYTLSEKFAIWRGKAWSRSILWEEILNTNLSVLVVRLDLPAYFWVGRHDYTTNYHLVRDFFLQLNAPLKGFYTFEDSAHSPLFEEPGRAINILLQDTLRQRTDLADQLSSK